MLMSLIPTRVHGILDYLVGLLLIAAPWLVGFADNRAATMVPVVLGVGTIVYSLITNYELALVRVLPMNAHLGIDLLSGLVLAASPWLFHFSGRIVWPHVTVGIMEILIVLISCRVPSVLPSSAGRNSGSIGQTGVA